MRKAIRALTLLALATVSFPMLDPHGARAEDAAVEALSSQQKDFVFEVRKGQGSKVIKGFDARAGQKIRLVGFGAMSLDQLQKELKVDAGDALLNLGSGQQLRIAGANADVVSAIQIQLDRSQYSQPSPMISMRSVWTSKRVSRRACGEPILGMAAFTAGRCLIMASCRSTRTACLPEQERRT